MDIQPPPTLRRDIAPRPTIGSSGADSPVYLGLLNVLQRHNATTLINDSLHFHGIKGGGFNISEVLYNASDRELGGSNELKEELIRAYVPLELDLLRPIACRWSIVGNLAHAYKQGEELDELNLPEFGARFFEDLYQEAERLVNIVMHG